MGANQSYETDFADVISASHMGDRKDRSHGDGIQYKRRKAKPVAPHRPTITAVTHNAVSLTWLPPRHALHAIIAYTVEMCKPTQAKQWITLTKNCQGTHYEARHLDSDTQYVFRVRAENIFGTGKPSAPSESVSTKIFEMTSDLNCYISPSISSLSSFSEQRTLPKSASYDSSLIETTDSVFVGNGSGSIGDGSDAGMVKSASLPGGPSSSPFALSQNPYGSLRRRHSFNVQLDGRLSTILNHSDRFHSTNSMNSSTSTIVFNNNNNNSSSNGCGSSNNIHTGNNDTDNAKTRRSYRMQRDDSHRFSLQPRRKGSVPILLPGAGSSSLDRLRESRVSVKSTSSCHDVRGNNNSTLTRQRSSTNRNRKSRESRNSLGSTASDSNTNTSSTSSSKDDNNKTGQGSRLSLQSALSDVTMSNHSNSSDEPSSRPVSYSDNGEHVMDFSSFLGYGNNDQHSRKTHENGDLKLLDNQEKGESDDYDDERNENVDEIYKLKRDLKNMEITEEKLKFHDLKERLKIDLSDSDGTCLNNNINAKDYYQSLDNPWQHVTNSVNGVSENIMAAPFSDDIKIALNAKNHADHITGNGYRSANQNWSIRGSHDNDDFRTLRSVLQSDHMIVKQSRSMPEVVGVVFGEGGETRTLTRGKLTTIEDEDEEEEAVRVTTL